MSHIPRIVFTYWEGDQLSVLHYYTILSLCTLNPHQEILIYTSNATSSTFITWTTQEHSIPIHNKISLHEIVAISPRVKLIPIAFEADYQISNQLSIVHKADFVRIVKLYEHGGMWFDFDILFIKPLPAYLFESTVDIYYFSYEDTIATGLLLSTPQNPHITELYEKVRTRIHHVKNYQGIGPDLWRECLYQKSLASTVCLSTSMVYPYICTNYHLFFITSQDNTQNDTFGIHWYNGGAITKQFINLFDNNRIHPDATVCHKYLYMIRQLQSK